MKCVALLIALAVFVAVEAGPEPGVHRVTGKYVTHVHKYRIPGSGGDEGGRGGKGGKGGKGGRGGKCQEGLIKGTAGKLNSGFQRLTSGVAGGLGAKKKHPGLVGNAIGGIQTALDNVAGGLDQATSDFFCGFNRVFDKIGSKATKGDIIGGLASGLNTFVTGAGSFFGNLGTNALGAITGGVSDAIHGRSGHGRKKRGGKH